MRYARVRAGGKWRAALQCSLLLVSLLGWMIVTRGELMAWEHAAVRAPEFPADAPWLNTDAPLRLAELRGKVVLLDFWTSGCINCLHVLPDLEALEQKYASDLVVIGVHTAKFSREGDTEHIRQALRRYDIRHPVVNDRDWRIWSAYAVRAWPTLMVIRPDGYVLGPLAGEGHRATLEQVIDDLLATAQARGTLRTTPGYVALEHDVHPVRPLSFPGKVLAHAPSQRLALADSHHSRIVIADFSGTVLAVAGSGARGAADGDFASATFYHPQGLAWDDHRLYVADTGNHLLRCLDLQACTVTTIAGNGTQARGVPVPGTGTHVALNSPWDLALRGSQLFLAMAGSHQVWVMDLETGHLAPFAGSGREDLVDGPRLQAALAQPSGLAIDGTHLYVADSESSAIRAVGLDSAGLVHTLVGEGLFEFGDTDGLGPQDVRLQHPLGVAVHGTTLYVADTYNHKIKTVDLQTARTTTYLGRDKAGYQDGHVSAFDEPGGLSLAAGLLYIADTNNHAIRVADLATGEVTTLALRGLAAPEITAAAGAGDEEVVQVAPQVVQAGTAGRLLLHPRFPDGYHLNPSAPFHYRVSVRGEGIQITEAERTGQHTAPALPVAIPFQAVTGTAMATVDATFYYCREDDTGVCVIQSVRWEVPLQATPQGSATDVTLSYQAEVPVIQRQL